MRLLVACVMAAAAGSAGAEDKPPTAPVLRLVSAPGKPVGFKMQFESSSDARTSTTQPDAPRVSTYEMDMALEVGAAEASGALPVVLRVERVRGKAERLGRGSFGFDSESPLPEEMMTRADVFEFTMLAGTQFQLSVDPSGAVAAVTGIEAARTFATARVGDDESLARQCQIQISEEAIRALFLSVIGPAPLPKPPVTKSTTWSDTDKLALNSWQASYDITRKLTVSSISATAVRVVGKGTVKLGVSMNVALMPLSMSRSLTTSAASDWTLSAADGLPMSGSETMSLEGSVSAGRESISAKHRATFKITRLGAPPPAAARPKSGAADAAKAQSAAAEKIVAEQAAARKQREVDGRRGAWGISADGTLVAAGNPQCALEVWRADGKTPIAVLTGHTTLITSVAFDVGRRTAIACAEDGTVRSWNYETGVQNSSLGKPNETRTLHGMTIPDGYRRISKSPDGRFAAYIDSSLAVWDSDQRAWMEPGPMVLFPRDVVFLADSRRLLGWGGEELLLFDLLAKPTPDEPLPGEKPDLELKPLWERRKSMFARDDDPDGVGKGRISHVCVLEQSGLVVARVETDILDRAGKAVLRAWSLDRGAKRWETAAPAGSLVSANQAPWIIVRDGSTVRLVSPKDGKILRTLPPGPASSAPGVFVPDGSAWFDADRDGNLIRVPVEPPLPAPGAGGAQRK